MPFPRKYDYRCADGHTFDLTLLEYREEAQCACGAAAKIVWIKFPGTTRGSNAQHFDPVTVFRKPDGTYAFPGRSNDPTPAGMQRVQLTTVQQVRRFERDENARIKRQRESSLEREDRGVSPMKRARRETLRRQMQGQSPIENVQGKKVHQRFTGPGRKFAEYAMRKSDQRPSLSHQATKFEPSFHIEAFSFEAGSRAAHNDVDTGGKDRK